ncbi:MAG: BMP family ABC transporter substrate-binding protein [Firmicutes bacterium]|nr:BMP family ABC transporter substrate-binding protein [Bacillota bacterium]
MSCLEHSVPNGFYEKEKENNMKKLIALMMAIVMVLCCFAACGSSGGDNGGDEAAETKRIAMICDPVGVNPFLTQIVDKLEEMKAAQTYPMDYTVVECADDTAWSENIRASVEEGYDMILVVGWQGADPLNEVATQFPDKAQYAIIDTTCDNENVKSYIFKPQEAAYLIGIIAASVSADAGQPDGPFGGVHANPGQGSFEWRWGYMEGARSVNPELQMDDFLFNYTKSYTDAAIAKELALQQAAQGCVFINAASAVADYGTFEAAAEKGFYTSGQDTDMTNPENPNIITSQVKYTGVVAEMAVKEFFETGLQPGVVTLGLADGVVGAVYITDDGTNPRNEVLTDEIVARAREAAEKIKSGELVLEVPLEEDYSF